MTTFEVLISVAGGLVSLVATGAIPWAYMVGARLARIESVISNGMKNDITGLKIDSDEMLLRVSRLETAVAVLEHRNA